jgi:hypothetical protein
MEEKLLNFFKSAAIATKNEAGQYIGTFYLGDKVNYRVDVTSFNVVCSHTFIIAETYDAQDRFKGASSKWIGVLGGGNNYFIADIPYTISSSEQSIGTWNAAGYLWCDDSTGENAQKLISRSYTTSFNVAQKSQTCLAGYTGSFTCRSGLSTNSGNGEDVFKLYINNDCTSEYKRTDECTSGEMCSAGSCIVVADAGTSVEAGGTCGDGLCTGEDDSLNCPADCTTNSPNTNPSQAASTFPITTILIVIGAIIAIFALKKYVFKF